MTTEDLNEIINSDSWIKGGVGFLIGMCRELAKELIETQKKVPWTTHVPHKDEWGNVDWRDTGEMGG